MVTFKKKKQIETENESKEYIFSAIKLRVE